MLSLNDLLSEPDISVSELFQQPDILNQIKYKFQIFIDFCKRNEDFTKIMITRGIKTPMCKHENDQMRKVSHIASDILTCDNDVIADLFVIDASSERIRCYSSDDDEVIEDIVTGEEVIIDRKPQKQIDEFSKKYIYLIELLSYVQQTNLDENCINYMVKVLNTIIRVKGQHVYEFFQKKPDILKKMIELTNYPSISYAIVKLINEIEDEKFRSFKIEIINMIIKEFLQKVKSQQFPVYAQFVQEIFDKNKHRGEEIDEIKIVTQPLVSHQIIDTMIQGILANASAIVTSNSLLYLLKVVQRMNVDQQKDPYSYRDSSEDNKPTMNFQANSIFQNFDKLLNLAPLISRQKYTTLQILTYYDLLLKVCHNSWFKSIQIDTGKAILTLLEVINQKQGKFNGIIKNKIVTLIETLVKRDPKLDICEISAEIKKQIQEQIAKLQASLSTEQGKCYHQKLKILITSSRNPIIQAKYSGLLAPTNYTQNRGLKIKQLEFAKVANANSKNLQIVQIQPLKQSKQIQSPAHENLMEERNGQIGSRDVNRGSIGINLSALNDKIKQLKSKKQHKSEQQGVKRQQPIDKIISIEQSNIYNNKQQWKNVPQDSMEILLQSNSNHRQNMDIRVERHVDRQIVNNGQECKMQKQKYKIEDVAKFHVPYLILF